MVMKHLWIIQKWRIWQTMNIKVELNPAFKEVNRSKRRYIVMKGSAGSGKSVDTATNYYSGSFRIQAGIYYV